MRQFFETSIPKGLHISKINERDVITVESLIKFWSFFMSKTITNTWESLYTDGKWSTHQMYDFGFSRRFVLVRV
jgi:hypothetical protein